MFRVGSGRICERDVPESQHTIFVRGLPGHMGVDEIREFLKEYGSCTFDFVKVSPDRTKLYVAIRFDDKACAREVMERYSNEGEMLGYRVELTWFRDIRRYLAHCAKQGIRPRRGGGRSGDFDRGYRGRERYPRSPTRSPDRGAGGRSRSASAASGDSRRRSYSRSRSAASRSRSRSRSVSSPRKSTPRSEREKSLDYSDIVKKERASPPIEFSPSPPPTKKSKREKRSSRREKRQQKRKEPEEESPKASDMEMDEGELVEEKPHKQDIKPQIMQHEHVPQQLQPPPAPAAAAPPSFYERHLAAGAVAAAATAQSVPPAPEHTGRSTAAESATHIVKQEHKQQPQQQPPHAHYIVPPQLQRPAVSQKAPQMVPKVELRNQSIMLDMSDPKNASPPLFKSSVSLLSSGSPSSNQQQFNGSLDVHAQQPMLRNVPSATASANSSISAGFFSSTPVVQAPELPLNNFKEIQRAILQDVRYKPHEAEEEDQMGSLRLSSLSRKTTTEEKREEKLAKLSPEMRERVEKKKRQLELSYRSDCEAYGLVVNKLLSKDRSLEDRLKIALLETMKELEQETMKQLDEFVDQLSFLCA